MIDPVSAPALSLQSVDLSLGSGAARVHILKDISLDIAQGEAVGLVGPSGSGKSTLLMCMAGLEQPDQGRITILGETITTMNEDRLAQFRGRHIGVVFFCPRNRAFNRALCKTVISTDVFVRHSNG